MVCLDRKRGQHVLDDLAIAEEIGGCHDIVRDVTASPSRHENLGADRLRAIEKHDPLRTIALRGRLCRENRGRQPGGACTDHRNIMHVVMYRH